MLWAFELQVCSSGTDLQPRQATAHTGSLSGAHRCAPLARLQHWCFLKPARDQNRGCSTSDPQMFIFIWFRLFYTQWTNDSTLSTSLDRMVSFHLRGRRRRAVKNRQLPAFLPLNQEPSIYCSQRTSSRSPGKQQHRKTTFFFFWIHFSTNHFCLQLPTRSPFVVLGCFLSSFYLEDSLLCFCSGTRNKRCLSVPLSAGRGWIEQSGQLYPEEGCCRSYVRWNNCTVQIIYWIEIITHGCYGEVDFSFRATRTHRRNRIN